jgi:hypothetical protein
LRLKIILKIFRKKGLNVLQFGYNKVVANQNGEEKTMQNTPNNTPAETEEEAFTMVTLEECAASLTKTAAEAAAAGDQERAQLCQDYARRYARVWRAP